MRLLNWFLVMLAVALLAGAGLARWLEPGWRPDLFAPLLVFIAVRAEKRQGVALAWTLGLVKDLLSAGPLGQYALMYLAMALVFQRLSAFLDTRNFLIQAALSTAACFLGEGAALVAAFLGTEPAAILEGIGPLAGASLITGVCGMAVIKTLDRFGRRLPSAGRTYGRG